jgi:hypothetical protein
MLLFSHRDLRPGQPVQVKLTLDADWSDAVVAPDSKALLSSEGKVRNGLFLQDPLMKHDHSPRQARDVRRENSPKRGFFLQGTRIGLRPTRCFRRFCRCYTNRDTRHTACLPRQPLASLSRQR